MNYETSPSGPSIDAQRPSRVFGKTLSQPRRTPPVEMPDETAE
jgi:hypothetical protein